MLARPAVSQLLLVSGAWEPMVLLKPGWPSGVGWGQGRAGQAGSAALWPPQPSVPAGEGTLGINSLGGFFKTDFQLCNVCFLKTLLGECLANY